MKETSDVEFSQHQEDVPQEPGKIARRDFLKSSLVVGLATASGALALNLGASTAEAAARKMPSKWDETFDVVVIGSGFAGLAAAAEAAGKGASVVILEKMPIYGGNSIINGGEYNAWTDGQHLRETLKLGDDSAEWHKNDTLKGGDFLGYPELVEVLAEGAPKALDWMVEEGGLKLRPIVNRAGGHSKYRTHTCVEASGRGYVEALRRIVDKRGAKVRLRNEVTWIWRKDTDGPILGVEVNTGRRKVNIAVRKGLVLASGGFSRDVAMRRIYVPYLDETFNCSNQKGATGEMIRYAKAIGAETIHMSYIQLYPFADPETGTLDVEALFPFRGPGVGIVYVTEKGKRFVNELERRDVISNAEMKTGGKKTYSIFNHEMVVNMGSKEEEVEKGLARGRFVKADSIAELAGKIGIDADVLVATIKQHNAYIKNKKDPDYQKNITDRMVTLEQGPFYAVAQWPAVHHTMGGLRINTNAQVLDIWGKIIPRLYAAGEVTGGVHGSNRLGANAIPDATVFGRIAGTNAASGRV
ncbi:Mrd [Geobacter sulfurreducens]|nr:Mrd [Geobacter sulfurreducens]